LEQEWYSAKTILIDKAQERVEELRWGPVKVDAFNESVEPDGKSYMMMSIRWWGNNDGDLLKTVHKGWIKETTNQWHYGKKKSRTFMLILYCCGA
jgi:hypothetical protein